MGHENLLNDYPIIPFDLTVCEMENGIFIDKEGVRTTIDGIDKSQFKNFLYSMDGKKNLKELAQKHKIHPEDALNLVSSLSEAKFLNLRSTRVDKVIDPQSFAKICRKLYPKWKEELFSTPFWEKLMSGKANRTELVGWLLENYHFIEGATVRLSMVVSTCRNERIREHFAQHFIEEYDHHKFFMRSLNILGISKEMVKAHRPLPSTLAILGHMRECGKRDAISYATCSAFLESTGEDRKDASTFYDLLDQYYDQEGPGFTKPMRAHSTLDEDYGHNEWLEKICSEVEILERERADDALQSARTLVETLKLWTSDIGRTYGALKYDDLFNQFQYR